MSVSPVRSIKVSQKKIRKIRILIKSITNLKYNITIKISLGVEIKRKTLKK